MLLGFAEVAVDYYRLVIIHKFVWVCSHLLRLLLRILLKFVIWKGGVRCEFLSVLSYLDGYLWLNRVFLFCLLLMAIFSMANGAVVHETHVVVCGTWVEPFHVNGILYVIICHLRGSVKIKLNAADRLLSKYLKVLVMEITFEKLLFSGILWYREKKSFMCMVEHLC